MVINPPSHLHWYVPTHLHVPTHSYVPINLHVPTHLHAPAHLHVPGNQIGDRGLAALSEAITQTHSVAELGLGCKFLFFIKVCVIVWGSDDHLPWPTPADNPFGLWGINSLVQVLLEYPTTVNLPFVHGVKWLELVEPLQIREFSKKTFSMDGDVFDFFNSLRFASMRGPRAAMIRKQVCPDVCMRDRVPLLLLSSRQAQRPHTIVFDTQGVQHVSVKLCKHVRTSWRTHSPPTQRRSSKKNANQSFSWTPRRP